jgi:hypothetical protein
MMVAPKAPHVVETCLIRDIESTLGALTEDYDLVAMSSHQVGSGFGARIEAVLVFRLREPAEESNGNGNHRRRPMPPVPLKNRA